MWGLCPLMGLSSVGISHNADAPEGPPTIAPSMESLTDKLRNGLCTNSVAA